MVSDSNAALTASNIDNQVDAETGKNHCSLCGS